MQAATAAASAAVSLATQSGIAVASASGLVQGSLVGSHNAGYNNNKIRSENLIVAAFKLLTKVSRAAREFDQAVQQQQNG